MEGLSGQRLTILDSLDNILEFLRLKNIQRLRPYQHPLPTVLHFLPMNTSTSSVLTHIVSKTFAGIGVLDFLHNSSVAYFDHQGGNTFVKVLTGMGFRAAACVSN